MTYTLSSTIIVSFVCQNLQALEKYRYEQSLEHTSQFIEKLEKELEEYHAYLARYKKAKEDTPKDSVINT
jgi:hypothetical protein